jgi:geranylgeranyl pyrophosphate synthase
LLLGDLALTTALGAPQADRARFAGEIGAATRRISEGQMVDAEDRFDVERTAERCTNAVDLRAGTPLALAARLGAIAAGAGEVDAYAGYGRALGIAYQLSEDIRELTFGDQLTRRRPGSDLREGVYTLPVVLALGADDELRGALGGSVSASSVPPFLARARETGALEEAGAECRRQVECALEVAARAPGRAPELLTTLAKLPLRRLAGPAGEPRAEVRATG